MHYKIFYLFILITLQGIAQNSFPKSWEGDYEGILNIYAVDSTAMKVQMRLGIHPTKVDSIMQWKMTYIFKGQEDVRDYLLKTIDAEKGHYLIDEQNSIEIDSYYRNGIFTSFFEVMNSFIITEYQWAEDRIFFDIISTENKPKISGNTVHEGEEIPEVSSFPVNGRQEAILYKL
jgi:hypothetical protein